jgi:hypothetical protein
MALTLWYWLYSFELDDPLGRRAVLARPGSADGSRTSETAPGSLALDRFNSERVAVLIEHA